MTDVIKVGDTVKHDFSETYGTVLAIVDDPDDYDYKVEFTIENGLRRIDWYRRKVLVKVS